MTQNACLPYRPNVGIMLFNRRGELFLGRRADMETIWQCPQGGIDGDENPETAARRELYEETGVRHAQILGTYPEWISYDFPEAVRSHACGGGYRGQTQLWFAMRHLGADEAINLAHTPDHPPEFDRWVWVAPNEIAQYDLGFKKTIYDQVLPYLCALAPAL